MSEREHEMDGWTIPCPGAVQSPSWLSTPLSSLPPSRLFSPCSQVKAIICMHNPPRPAGVCKKDELPP